ncbi:hypothetical protein [Roseibium sediminicola]|uniref:Uncharacterized protein n=1 Tax=Roseibium sediminicola TaxID=2933272 RepID=A0ABT0GYC6_9HYPH|nr:hypothetical protein [Roseibium sp. CAU 1639]MCK7614431.1 hypothetical protein [Roseibium sp. CAU 1639]
MQNNEPFENETPLAFVERADTMGLPDETINSILRRHSGLSDDREIQALKLKSRVFWERFFTEHVRGIHERGGSRYAAVNFIARKNGQAGQERLTATQIDALVDAVGAWQR